VSLPWPKFDYFFIFYRLLWIPVISCLSDKQFFWSDGFFLFSEGIVWNDLTEFRRRCFIDTYLISLNFKVFPNLWDLFHWTSLSLLGFYDFYLEELFDIVFIKAFLLTSPQEPFLPFLCIFLEEVVLSMNWRINHLSIIPWSIK